MSDSRRSLSADEAVTELYAAHWHSLVRLGVLLTGDRETAADVVQDSFVALHQRWDRLHDTTKAAAYLRTSVVNRARSVHRHRRVVRDHAPTPPPDAPGADAGVLDAWRRDQVIEALASLPRRQREVLALRYWSEQSEAEIASTLGISPGAVKSHASRGAEALRARLATIDSFEAGGLR